MSAPGVLERGSVWTVAQELLACVGERLADTEAGAPARACVVPGTQIAWDECECGGQLTVHVPQSYPSRNFPVLNQAGPYGRGCGVPHTVVEYVVTILRCAPVPGEDGAAPSCERLSVAAQVDLDDRWAVAKGVACCLGARPFLIQDQLALGAESVCVGSQLRVLVRFDNCEAC